MGNIRGIDVSKWQDPAEIDWTHLRDSCQVRFAFVRAAIGDAPDLRFCRHVERAREAGIQVGAYLFFRPEVFASRQLLALDRQMTAAGLGPGDILPALDVERHGTSVKPVRTSEAWQEPVRWLLEAMDTGYGGVHLYLSASDWAGLGRPAWVSCYRLWTPHWPQEGKAPQGSPCVPAGCNWAIWQNLVGVPGSGVQQRTAKGALDQNVAVTPIGVMR